MIKHIAYNVIKTIKKIKTSTAELWKSEDGFMVGFPTTFFSSSGAGPTSYINSVQQVSVVISGASTSGTATISAVGANAFLVFQGQTCGGNNYTTKGIVTLTNSTTVTVTLGAGSVGGATVNCQVIDPTSSLVSSVQFGSITLTTGTGSATISSVTTSLSAVFFLGSTESTNTGNGAYSPVTLASATSVTATRSGSGSTGTVNFVVVSFNPLAINNIQQFSISASSTSFTQTITSVVMGNTIIAWGGNNIATNADSIKRLILTNSTTVTATSGVSQTSISRFAVIEFVPGVTASVQRGSILLGSAVTSNTATVTSVNTAKTICNFTGYQASDVNVNTSHCDLAQTSGTVLTAARNTGTNTATSGYEDATFN